MSREEKKEKEKESVLVISISSTSSSSSYGEEEEEEEEVEVRSAEEKGRDDDECCILPSDPFADDLILNLSLCQRNDDGDDLAILFVRGQVIDSLYFPFRSLVPTLHYWFVLNNFSLMERSYDCYF